MKIQILSDLHLEFEVVDPPKVEADMIVLAGDIHVGLKGLYWAREFDKKTPIVYVLGNHEYYRRTLPQLRQKMQSLAQDTNVFILENESLSLEGVHFFGCTLWSDFKLFGNEAVSRYDAQLGMNDYKLIRFGPEHRRLRANATQILHMESLRRLRDFLNSHTDSTKIIVTHHAPSLKSVQESHAQDPMAAAFVTNLDDLVSESGAKLWIHGHTHESCDYMLGSTRVISNPRGYPYSPNPDFDGHLLVEV